MVVIYLSFVLIFDSRRAGRNAQGEKQKCRTTLAELMRK